MSSSNQTSFVLNGFVSVFLPGSGFQTYSSRRHIDEDIDLDVDGDDSKQYGEPQYPSRRDRYLTA